MKSWLLFFSLWSCMASLVSSDCGSPPNELNAYPDSSQNTEGATITYSCHAGYVSGRRSKYQCQNGAWKRTISGRCTPKQCGHPGDSLNADFNLKEKDDFIFGARVEYVCKEGYQMASQLNFRQCLADGWSNDVPHCEVVMCPHEPIAENVIITSGTYEDDHPVPFGNVLQFDCKNANLKLNGQREIYCTAEGTWSNPFPTCKEIICDKPDIPDGNVQPDKAIYKFQESLSYTCRQKFKAATSTLSICTKWGWTPTPVCEPLTCERPNTQQVGYYEKFKYNIGEEVVLVCQTGHKTPTNEQQDTLICTEDGWNPKARCEPIICSTIIQDKRIIFTPEYRRINQGWSYSYSYSYSFPEHDVIDYSCVYGFKPETKTKITCRLKGWDPSPKCTAIICNKPDIPGGYVRNGKAQYKFKEYMSYACHKNFKPTTTTITLTCEEHGWNQDPECEPITCEQPNPESVGYSDKNKYNIDDVIELKCREGYKTATDEERLTVTCTATGWEPSIFCKPITCSTLGYDENIEFVNSGRSNSFPYGHEIEYSCRDGYSKETEKQLICRLKGWEPSPKCIEKKNSCMLPNITNAHIYDPKREYPSEETLMYSCESGYKSVTGFWWGEMMCKSGEWQQIPQCIDKKTACPEPPRVNNTVITTKPKVFVNEEEVQYVCIFTNEKLKNKCENGTWIHDLQCAQNCPVPEISNGSSKNQSKKYDYDTKLEYECNEEYTHSKVDSICTETGWNPMPQCTILTCEVPNIDNGIVHNVAREKKEYNINDTLQYYCFGNWKRSSIDPVCTAKGWNPEPKCGDGICLMPPKIANGDIDGEVEPWYEDGSRVNYKCKSDHVVEGDKTVTCSAGVWSKPPQCMKPCYWQYDGKKYKIQHKKNRLMYCPYSKLVTCENGELLNACPGTMMLS
ncbi:complement factor H-like isoform X3 [Erpetoichthys calabaricus]|uniref:complement factor H-like isoform X3 n=1 Tax=Erpetoichthys calabaricus TaxID=27687 RepID=UPI0022344062|nr:complement factor H-like isoform X3 [Erpetoichthys calabaricus]